MSLIDSTNPAIPAGWAWACPLRSTWWKLMAEGSGRKVKWEEARRFHFSCPWEGVVKYLLVISARKASFHAHLSCLSETQIIRVARPTGHDLHHRKI